MAEPELSLKSLPGATLPEFDPPPQLWSRIVAARARQQRKRRFGNWAGAIAATLVAAAIMLVQIDPGTMDTALTELEQHSRELEQSYASLRQPAPASLESEAELHAIERALQYAYDRGASPEELAPLWRQRNELLGALIALSADGAQLTRI